jgi:hypothetical protein
MALSIRKSKKVDPKFEAPSFGSPLPYDEWSKKYAPVSTAATHGPATWSWKPTTTTATLSGTWSTTPIGMSFNPSPHTKEAQRRIMEALVNDIVLEAYPEAKLAR